MDYTKHLSSTIAVVAVLSLTACAIQPGAGTTRMSLAELEAYQINCRDKDAQLAFLEAQLPRPWPNNTFGTTTTNGEPLRDAVFHADFGASVLKHKIRDLKTWCPSS